MASKEVEDAVNDFANQSTLRGKTPICSARFPVSTRDQDRRWDKLVNDTFKDENILVL